MKRPAPANPSAKAAPRIQPSAETAALALAAAAEMLVPVAAWAIRSGVGYPAFAEMLKRVFVAAARRELEAAESGATQSALSILSGVHRKDIRQILAGDEPRRALPRPSVPAQVYTHWLAGRRWRDRKGHPKPLPRTGEGMSFETLCRECSNDVHPRSVLDELLRLGLVALEGERVVPQVTSFVPAPRLDELTALFAANAGDHLAAAVHNLSGEGPPFLEQSVYADGLTQESIDQLHVHARALWAKAFESMVAKARQGVDRDRSSDGIERMRFGAYFYSEPAPRERAAEPHAGRRRGRPRKAGGDAT
ncbi:MAG TPA: DUF6502 family protein [Caldimonas sp.]|nr:DUF6502 family protein [Caldimonas sp.]